jgi:hypothetical protein
MDPEASAASDSRRESRATSATTAPSPPCRMPFSKHASTDLVAGIDVDDAVRGEADLGKRGRKKILPRDAPEDSALCPRRDAGSEKGGRCAINGRIAAPGDLVQRAKREPPARKTAVDRLDPEWEH